MNPITYRRAVWIFGAIIITASVSGYFMGLQQTGSQISQSGRAAPQSAAPAPGLAGDTQGVPTAVRYGDQDWLREGPNADWKSHIATLVQPVTDIATLTNVSDAERADAMQQRAARRAFDGAPPIVPHPIAQDSSAACLACHGPGLVIKDKVASKMSHAHYSSCTQCHVPAGGHQIPTGESPLQAALAANQFTSVAAPLKGDRAWPTAPPTVPHPTLMRSDCMSCHGPQGLFGLRTPHPERQACVQCHAPQAVLDQRIFAKALAPVSAP